MFFSFILRGSILALSAILIGVAIGLLCRFSNKSSSSFGLGVVAAIMAMTLFCGGQIAWHAWSAHDQHATTRSVTEETIILELAGNLAWDMRTEGIDIAWPPGVSVENASCKDDFPPEIWRQAEQKWNRYRPQQKATAKQRMQQSGMATMLNHSENATSGPWRQIGYGGLLGALAAGGLAFMIGGRFMN